MVDGNKIKELREAAGMSSEDLAKRVYISQSMIIYIELGAKQPSVKLLKSIADLFGVTVDSLIKEQSA